MISAFPKTSLFQTKKWVYYIAWEIFLTLSPHDTRCMHCESLLLHACSFAHSYITQRSPRSPTDQSVLSVQEMRSIVPYVDGFSAFTSFVGFLVTLAYVQDTHVRMWDNVMIFTTMPGMAVATQNFASTLLNTCTLSTVSAPIPAKTGPYTIFLQQQEWSNNTYTGISVGVDNGQSYQPWIMLQWVLLCSVIFQGGRCLAYRDLEDDDDTELFQYIPSRGPDFWRWIEYALTAPLQIVIIAGSFYLRETVVLTLMAALQGALVLFGYVIELEIQTLYLCRIATSVKQQRSKRVFLSECKLVFLLLSSYVFHVIIWTILIVKFHIQGQALLDCQNPSRMPPVIVVIIVLECLLFTMFGIVLTVQTMQAIFRSTITTEYMQHTWNNVAVWYTALSLTAKLVLEWGFIYLLQTADAGNN